MSTCRCVYRISFKFKTMETITQEQPAFPVEKGSIKVAHKNDTIILSIKLIF
jgi:hypothetical protein